MPDALAASATLQGLPAEIATWRLLSLAGRADASLVEFRENWRGDAEPEAMLPLLEFHHLPAHCVRIDDADLAGLDTPALLQLRDGSWLVLRALRDKDNLIVEGADGVLRASVQMLGAHLSGLAVELLPRLPEGASLWARFRRLVLLQRGPLMRIALAAIPLQLLALVSPELSGLVLGRALPDGATALLHLAAVSIVAAALFTGGITWFRERVVLSLMTRLEVAVKRSFLDHVLRLGFPQLQRFTTGEFLQAFSGISVARTLFAERALGTLVDGALVIGYLLAMGVKLWAPTLLMLLVSILVAVLALVAGHAQARQQAEEVKAQARQRGYLTELIAGVRTIKAAGAERASHARWLRYFGHELDFTLRRLRIGLWPQVGMDATRQAFSVTMLVWGGYSVLQGSLGLGSMFGFLLLGEAFLRAMAGMVDAGLALLVLKPQLARTAELFAMPTRPCADPGPAGKLEGPVVLTDVWFRYAPDGPYVLREYHLELSAGANLVLEGPSGCGKSTILRLLAGLYVPERGSISLGGRDPERARERLLYLPQFIQIYAGTIMDNLRILSGGATRQRLLEAAALTRFDAVVDALAMRYDTPLPHGGATFSGGQRQLLALTAALASDRDLLLLDEPMANIDQVGAEHMTRLLQSQGRTIICAGHTAQRRGSATRHAVISH
jgi:ABC-type bacteriocin/lantibiotic exporter with double-glycine peptidase domain